MSFDFYVALPYGAVSWSAVSDCGFFLIILTFFILIHYLKIQQKSGIGVIKQFLGHKI